MIEVALKLAWLGILKNRRLSLFLLVGLLCYSNDVIGQDTLNKLLYNTPALYFSMGEVTPVIKKFQKDNRIFNVETIGVHDYNDIESGAFRKAVTRAFPDSLVQGIGVLDWEGKDWAVLRKADHSSPFYQTILGEYVQTLKFAKVLRPNVLWGIYGIPFTTNLSSKLDIPKSNSGSPAAVMEACDVFCPDLYQAYRFNDWFRDDDSVYVVDNLKTVLTLASRYNKPVLAYVWGRYHPGNKRWGFQLIPSKEFVEHIRRIISVDVNGKKVSGIVWWGGYGVDKYYFNQKNRVIRTEIGAAENFDQYENKVIIENSIKILSILK